MEKKKTTKENKKEEILTSCTDKFCPIHGSDKLKIRGRSFQGNVIRKLSGRVTIQFERMIPISKYERYERRTTRIHSRLPDCMKDSVEIGDLVEVSETRPLSKMIHSVVVRIISKNNKNGEIKK